MAHKLKSYTIANNRLKLSKLYWLCRKVAAAHPAVVFTHNQDSGNSWRTRFTGESPDKVGDPPEPGGEAGRGPLGAASKATFETPWRSENK